MKQVFTTNQVAKICKVSPRTVSKWFDSGRLKGYRIPGSQDRRIPREHLASFLEIHGMEQPEELTEPPEPKISNHPARQEIHAQIDLAAIADVEGSRFPGMSYEEGVRAALEWSIGESDEKPLDN